MISVNSDDSKMADVKSEIAKITGHATGGQILLAEGREEPLGDWVTVKDVVPTERTPTRAIVSCICGVTMVGSTPV
jgi:hypothetical protein